LIDWTGAEQQKLLDAAAARISGTERSVGDALLRMGEDPRETNPYAARTFQRLQDAISRERGMRS
jgi:hypothetical protein